MRLGTVLFKELKRQLKEFTSTDLPNLRKTPNVSGLKLENLPRIAIANSFKPLIMTQNLSGRFGKLAGFFSGSG